MEEIESTYALVNLLRSMIETNGSTGLSDHNFITRRISDTGYWRDSHGQFLYFIQQ